MGGCPGGGVVLVGSGSSGDGPGGESSRWELSSGELYFLEPSLNW